ncbi:MAG: hypothetical protein H6710_24745 [Myxococcales bacterium]|nr:hypothetical protein [Myxococcales bacterium]
MALIAAWIVAAPAWRQLHGARTRWMPTWDMYAEPGLEIVRGRFLAVRGDHLEELDRYALLGHREPRAAPRWLRTIRGEAGALRVARALCERLGGDVAIRLDGQIATWDGWQPLFADVDDLCRPLGPRPITRRRRHE